MPYLGIFGPEFLKIMSYLKSGSRICLIAKFREKMKMPKIGTKNSFIWVFLDWHLKKYCHI